MMHFGYQSEDSWTPYVLLFHNKSLILSDSSEANFHSSQRKDTSENLYEVTTITQLFIYRFIEREIQAS